MTNWSCGARGSDQGRLRLMTTPLKRSWSFSVGGFTAEKHLQCRKTLTVMIFPNIFIGNTHKKNAWQMRYCGKRNGDFTAGKHLQCRKTL